MDDARNYEIEWRQRMKDSNVDISDFKLMKIADTGHATRTCRAKENSQIPDLPAPRRRKMILPQLTSSEFLRHVTPAADVRDTNCHWPIVHRADRVAAESKEIQPPQPHSVCLTDLTQHETPSLVAPRAETECVALESPLISVAEDAESPLNSCVDQLDGVRILGNKNVAGYLRSNLKTLHSVLQADADRVPDPPIEETHDLTDCVPVRADAELPLEAYTVKQVWKRKPESSKMVTLPDGKLYQEFAHHVSRIGLFTPSEGSNMLDPRSYTGTRITEGVYDSGEKFVDNTPWFPFGATTKDQTAKQSRALKERWRGKTYLEIVDMNTLTEIPPAAGTRPREHHPPEVPLTADLMATADDASSEDDDEVDELHEAPVQALIAETVKRSYSSKRAKPLKPKGPKHRYKVLEICTHTQNVTLKGIERGWHGLVPITIETGFDLYTEKGRKEGWKKLMKDLPDLIVAEWPCDPHCSWTHLNLARGGTMASNIRAAQDRVAPSIKWIAKVERWQRQRNKFFVAEQPSNCGSWKLPDLQEMQRENWSTILDMCQYGLKDPLTQDAYRHRTKLVHNSFGIHKTMQRLCPGKHVHQVTGGTTMMKDANGIWMQVNRSTFAGWYTPQFCDSLLAGVEIDLKLHPSQRQRHAGSTHHTYPATTRDRSSKSEQCPHRDCQHYCSTKSGIEQHWKQHHSQDGPFPGHGKRRKLTHVRDNNAPDDAGTDSVGKENSQIAAGSQGSATEAPAGADDRTLAADTYYPDTPLQGSSPIMQYPGFAPMQDLSKGYTDLEAQQHGFADANEWQRRTVESQAVGLQRIPLAPHERTVQPPEAQTPGEPPVPETRGAGAQTPMSLRRRTLKPMKKAAGMVPILRRERRTGYAEGSRRAGKLLEGLLPGLVMKGKKKLEKDVFPTARDANDSGAPALFQKDRDEQEQRLQESVDAANAAANGDTSFGSSPTISQEIPQPQGRPTEHGPPQQSRGQVEARPGVTPNTRRATDLQGYPHDLASYLSCEDHASNLHPTADLICDETDMPIEVRRIPESYKRLVRNAHRNLGHPGNYALVRLMKTAKCPQELITYARYMKCPTCIRRSAPGRVPRVSMPYRPTRFNMLVGVDVKYVKDGYGQSWPCLNILDLATGFNVFVPMPDRKAQTIADTFKWAWLSWASSPDKIVCDQGREFYGEFQRVQQMLGSKFRMIPTEAPWQNGMVERHGGVVGDIIDSIVQECSPVGLEQMRDVCLHACMSKNRRPGRTGYSPRTLVFGVDERLALSGLNHYLEEPDDAALKNASKDELIRQTMAFRKAAMHAVVELDHSEKWADAIKFPSRPSEAQLFLPGHQVVFWRKAKTTTRRS